MKNLIYNNLIKRFDKIFLLTLSHRHERTKAALKQLENIGLYNTNILSVYYATSFPYNDIIAKAFNDCHKGIFTKSNEYDCARNHYSIIKQSYDDPNCNHILIFEDDIQFYYNLSVINSYLENIPDDYDIIQFGGFTDNKNILKYLIKENELNDYKFVKHPDVGLWNASMYALSRKGMEYYLNFMNKLFWVADGPLYKSVKNNNINVYMTTIPIVIQANKMIVESDIRNIENDNINYETDNLYESLIDKNNYIHYDISSD